MEAKSGPFWTLQKIDSGQKGRNRSERDLRASPRDNRALSQEYPLSHGPVHSGSMGAALVDRSLQEFQKFPVRVPGCKKQNDCALVSWNRHRLCIDVDALRLKMVDAASSSAAMSLPLKCFQSKGLGTARRGLRGAYLPHTSSIECG